MKEISSMFFIALSEPFRSLSRFREAINIYLADCESQGITPEKPFKGNFNVRISSELHQKAALLAMEDKMSLNNFVAESIRERVFKESSARKKSHRTSR